MASSAGTLFLLLLLNLGAQVLAGVPPGFMPGRMVALERSLISDPENPSLNAEYALGLAKTGRCVQAEPHWDLGGDLAGAAHADCLREQGQARQAATLRDLEILASPRPLRHYLAQAQDLRVAGDLLGAEQAALQAAALQPQSKLVLALWIELAMDSGELDRAQTALALSQDVPGLAPSELLLAQARFLAKQGALEEAETLARQAGVRGRQPAHVVCLRTRILVEMGDAPLALMVLEQPRLDDREELCLVRARVAAYRALGEQQRAQEWEMLIWALAPQGALDTEDLSKP